MLTMLRMLRAGDKVIEQVRERVRKEVDYML